MGAMGCFRRGCDRVCCTRYSSNHGYICNDCYDELVDFIKVVLLHEPNTGIHEIIDRFMLTSKNDDYYNGVLNVDRFLESEFRR
jgi:hypothetical protein